MANISAGPPPPPPKGFRLASWAQAISRDATRATASLRMSDDSFDLATLSGDTGEVISGLLGEQGIDDVTVRRKMRLHPPRAPVVGCAGGHGVPLEIFH